MQLEARQALPAFCLFADADMAIQQINEIDDIPVGYSKSCNTPSAGSTTTPALFSTDISSSAQGLAPAIRRRARDRERHASRDKSAKGERPARMTKLFAEHAWMTKCSWRLHVH